MRAPTHRAKARIASAVDSRRPLLVFLRLLPKVDRWGTFALVLQIVAAGLIPVALMIVTGALVTVVSTGRSPLPGGDGPWAAVGALTALLLAAHVLVPFLGVVIERLAHRVDLFLRGRTLRAVLTPRTLAHLEDPELAEELAQARTVGTELVQMPSILVALAAVGSARLMAAGSAVVLFGFRWWAPVVLISCWVAANEAYRRGVVRLVSSLEGATDGFRRARYFSDLALTGPAAKELRLFGLAQWLSDRFDSYWRTGMREVWRQRGRDRRALLVGAALLVVGHALVCAALTRGALGGQLEAGVLVVYLQAVVGMAGFGWDADNQYLLRLGIAPVPHVLKVSEMARDERYSLTGWRTTPADAPRHDIVFDQVSFCYPGTERRVLDGLDLRLPAGRSLAIVGDNGSGKTTLLKLLCRFYDPTAGRVMVDGLDLRWLDAASWQRRVAAVFQDFARYPLSAYDNIAFGNLRRRDDDAALLRAVDRASVADVIAGLPAHWDTLLSREFEGGIEPSGGQWQRVALARVLFAVDGGARVLVLDEPTANLDIRAEATFYDQFLDLTQGLTTVLISHRFSTVRRADHIVVLAGGRIVESGSHEELLALGGRYAQMFSLQAAAYRQDSDA